MQEEEPVTLGPGSYGWTFSLTMIRAWWWVLGLLLLLTLTIFYLPLLPDANERGALGFVEEIRYLLLTARYCSCLLPTPDSTDRYYPHHQERATVTETDRTQVQIQGAKVRKK